MFPHYDNHNYDTRVAAFVETDFGTTTTQAFTPPKIIKPPMNFVNIAAKSLSFDHFADLLPPTSSSSSSSPSSSALKEIENVKKTQNRMIMTVDELSGPKAGHYCWQCSGHFEECRYKQDRNNSLRLKECEPGFNYCSLVDFGDIERTVEMDCVETCSPFQMRHLKISCCTSPLCNCIINGDQSEEDCRRIILTDPSVRQQIAYHPTVPATPENYIEPTVPNWFETYEDVVTEATTSRTSIEMSTEPVSEVTEITSTTTTAIPRTEPIDQTLPILTTTSIQISTERSPTVVFTSSRVQDVVTEVFQDIASEMTTQPSTSSTPGFDLWQNASGIVFHDDSSGRRLILFIVYLDIILFVLASLTNCYYCYNCPVAIPPTDPNTQAIECPTDKRVNCVVRFQSIISSYQYFFSFF